MREKFTGYCFDVKWIAGKNHQIADALSRAPLFEPEEEPDIIIDTALTCLGKHQNHIDPEISKVCRFCEEEEETFHHYITTCPALRSLRQEIFLDKQLPQDNSWSIRRIKIFILSPIIHTTLASKSGLSLIEKQPHEIGLPSDTDSSL